MITLVQRSLDVLFNSMKLCVLIGCTQVLILINGVIDIVSQVACVPKFVDGMYKS